MELLLNLAWLLLALPACWLWRGSRTAHAEHKFNSLQCMVALACLLVMLFPIISATDDLVAMRTEMEESPAGKRSMRQAAGEKASAGKLRLETPPAVAVAYSLTIPATKRCDPPLIQMESVLDAPTFAPVGRAPPSLRLA